MALPLVRQAVEQLVAELATSDPAELDDALEHAVWLIAQLRSDGARRLEVETDGTVIVWIPGEVTAGDGTYAGEQGVPLEPAAWARTLVAEALR